MGITDAEGVVTYVNDRFPEMIGCSRQELIGKPLGDFLDADSQSTFDKNLSGTAQVHRGVFETVILSKGGERIPVIFSSRPLFDEKANRIGALAVVTNVTELKEIQKTLLASLKEKEVLLQEIHHRVKNNLQLVLSLLRLQARKTDEPKVLEVLTDAQNRVFSMALVHEKLYQSPNLSTIQIGQYFKALTNHVVQAYQGSTPRVHVRVLVEALTFSIDKAVPLGMIVTELISNVLRHAFPDENRGELTVSLRRLDENRHELCVTDNGTGIESNDDVESGKSLGLDLVRTFTAQIDGTLEIECSGGTRVLITF